MMKTHKFFKSFLRFTSEKTDNFLVLNFQVDLKKFDRDEPRSIGKSRRKLRKKGFFG